LSWAELRDAIGLSAAAGQESSSHSWVLLQQRNPISDSPGMAFEGVALVPELNKIATAPQKPKWLRTYYLPEATTMDRH